MKRLFLVLSAAILLALGACQKAPELTVTGPTSIDMSADGSSGSITFTANRDWTVSWSESWVHVSPAYGKASDGPVTLSVTCSPNTTYEDRTATVTIKAEGLTQSVTVKQPQNLGVIVPTQTFDIKADTKSIEVEVQANMDYTVSVSADWIKQSGTKALTSKKLTFSIEENTIYDSREGRITIKPQSGAEQVISVRQQAKDGLELGTTIYEVGVSGGTLEIALKTNVELEVTPGADWIHYTETKALDNRTVILSIDPNDSDAERSGEVKISQKGGTLSSTVTVKQEKPVLMVEKTEYALGPDGGTLEIAVQTNVEFEVKPDADWIHYTETKALDNRTVVLSIDRNDGSTERGGEVKISQKGGTLSSTVTVKQEGPVLTVGQTEYTVGLEGGTLEIVVRANMEFEVKPGADWIHYTETKALDDKTVILSIDQNKGTAERSGEVKISQKGGTLSSTVTVKQEGPVLTVEQTEYTVGLEGGTLEIAVQANVEFEVKPGADWIHCTETKALDNKTVVLSIDQNKGTAERSGEVKISQKGGTLSCTVIIVQRFMPKAIDLGLSVYWAECNLGATKPEEYGDYYAWGETSPKNKYTWETYKFRTSGGETYVAQFSKYVPPSEGHGPVDNKAVLELEDDAAHVALGGSWRMPTHEECDELITQCTKKWTTQNGVEGILLTSKKNGNSIFLPASGYRYNTGLYDVGSNGNYWSSSIYTSDPERAWHVYFRNGNTLMQYRSRFYGWPVRPVSE